jgi:hypothetical protein
LYVYFDNIASLDLKACPCLFHRSALKSQELRLKGIRAEIDGAKNEIIILQVNYNFKNTKQS